jgi:hypothetical protein
MTKVKTPYNLLLCSLLLMGSAALSFGQAADRTAAQVQPGNWIKALPGATIIVGTKTATGNPPSPLAVVYTDYTLSTPQPGSTYTADANGNYTIYGNAGVYYVCVNGGGTSQCGYTSIGGGSYIAGTNIIPTGYPFNQSALGGTNPECLITYIPAGLMPINGTVKIQATILFGASSAGTINLLNSVIRRTLPNQLSFTDTTNLTFGGVTNPSFNTTAAKTYTSDVISITLDSAHDTYVIFRIDPASPGLGTVLEETFTTSYSTTARISVDIGSVAYDTIGTMPGTITGSLTAQQLLEWLQVHN